MLWVFFAIRPAFANGPWYFEIIALSARSTDHHQAKRPAMDVDVDSAHCNSAIAILPA